VIVINEYHQLPVAYWWRAVSEVSLSRLFFLLVPEQAIPKRKRELSQSASCYSTIFHSRILLESQVQETYSMTNIVRVYA
jgi:hypothetical protein